MRPLLQTLSALTLAGTIVPSILFFARVINLDATKLIMLLATILWFIVTPFWMGRNGHASPGD